MKMSDDVLSEVIAQAVDAEMGRSAYPEEMPPMPPMPAGRYADPEFYALEQEHLFKKTWLNVGHVSELPETGDYKLFEQLGLSVIVSRSADGQVRAFRNVCRHRGAALLTEAEGNAKRFICPYHAWGYDLEGKLRSVPEAHNFACLDKQKLPLLQVRCEVWRGFIFINQNEGASPLHEFLAPIEANVGSFPIEDFSVKGVIRAELECNWKSAFDNFIENYHIQTVHTKTIAPFIHPKSFTVFRLKSGHARMNAMKRGANTIFANSGQEAQIKTETLFSRYTLAFPRFPNGFFSLDPSGLSWMNFWPISQGRMLLEQYNLGKTMGSPEEDKSYWDTFDAMTRKILSEDVALFPGMRRAMEAGELTEVLLGVHEQAIYWYNEEIDRQIGVERIPERFRMEQVLGVSEEL
jgi:phenylpropionate dioxygenase-like ring-hydroxylating dioxygenase large terminal subunit